MRRERLIVFKEALFSTLRVGALQLPNRIIMAPLTRMRAGAASVPTPLDAEYYAQRASAGLIISEGTAISPQAQGFPNARGIYTAAQIAGWRTVTDGVHARGGPRDCWIQKPDHHLPERRSQAREPFTHQPFLSPLKW